MYLAAEEKRARENSRRNSQFSPQLSQDLSADLKTIDCFEIRPASHVLVKRIFNPRFSPISKTLPTRRVSSFVKIREERKRRRRKEVVTLMLKKG
jgi:hypothetical protein